MELLTTVSRRYPCICLCLLLALWVVFSGGLGAGAESPTLTMHQVEAAFLFNFAKLVTWPDDAFERSGSSLIINVLGEDPLRGVVEETDRVKTVLVNKLSS